MRFNGYQNVVIDQSEDSQLAHELVPMLGLGGHVGELLSTHKSFLCDSLAPESNRAGVARALGLILRHVARIAHLNDIELAHVGLSNLNKVDARARTLGYQGIDEIPRVAENLTMATYQDLAAQTDQGITAGLDPLSLSVPILGLEGEAGTLLVEMKKRYRRDSKVSDWAAFVNTELGDLLWYVASVARHLGLDLDDVVEEDLRRLARSALAAPDGASLDSGFPETERFPRLLHLRFHDRVVDGTPTASMTLIEVWPNVFPDGPVPRGPGKVQGYRLGAALGDDVNDNSRRADDYRFHDAVHLGFLAVLGWSPNLRSLMNLKRKSDPMVDDSEDGARAVFAEEGLAAILAKQASSNRFFETPNLVPEASLDLIAAVVDDLEVRDLPYRLWRDAISQGFSVLRKLAEAGGGYVLADLDARTLQYSKFPFRVERINMPN